MITTPPPGFDAAEFYRDVYLFHTWEVFPGHVTQGVKDVALCTERMGLPADLTGKRVLDIAPWNGFFGFECLRRGASELVSFGPDDPDHTGYNRTRDLLGLTNIRYVRKSVYDLSPEDVGTFDVVLFLGLIYHLRHPLLALDRIYDVCDGQLFVDSPYIYNVVVDRTLSDGDREAVLTQGSVMHKLPMLYYTGASETGDAFNWFMPNLKALHSLVQSSGFDIFREENDGGAWCWTSATKGLRQFEVGLEGFSASAQRPIG